MYWSTVVVAVITFGTIVIGHRDNIYKKTITKWITYAELKGTLDVIPTSFMACFAYGAFVAPTKAFYNIQTCQSDVRVNGKQQIGAFFSLSGSFISLIFVPILEIFIMPWLDRINGGPVDPRKKIVFSYLLGISSIITAIILEIMRRNSPLTDEISLCAAFGTKMSSFSAWYMYIPFGLSAFSSAIFIPAIRTFVYTQTPIRLRSTFTNLIMFSIVGGTTAYSTAFTTLPWFSENINDGKLEYIYCLYIVIGIVLAVIYYNIGGSYEWRDWEREKALSDRMTTSIKDETTLDSRSIDSINITTTKIGKNEKNEKSEKITN
eukprot:Pgem_evm1s18636